MICEICVDSVAGVRAAKHAGAQRVELCADLGDIGVRGREQAIQSEGMAELVVELIGHRQEADV